MSLMDHPTMIVIISEGTGETFLNESKNFKNLRLISLSSELPDL